LLKARRSCRFFPSIAELMDLAEDISRVCFEAARDRQTQQKLLAYQADAIASGLSRAEIQARIAELLAVVSDGVRMEAVTPPERRRQLHEDYRTPTTDNAARKRLLRAQLARVARDTEAVMTSAPMGTLSLAPIEELGMEQHRWAARGPSEAASCPECGEMGLACICRDVEDLDRIGICICGLS
jgi:IS1 family transposase